MPIFSASNRTQLVIKSEGASYPTGWGAEPIAAGNGTYLNMTGETLEFGIRTESSKNIVSSRVVTDLIQVGASAQGGFSFEHQFKEYDPLYLATLQAASYTAYGTAGVSGAFSGTLTLASGSITNSVAPTAGDAYTNLAKGQWFTLKPPSGATQAVKDYFASRAFRTHSTTAATSTVITLDPATPINTTIATTSMAAGAQISTSRATNGTTMQSFAVEVQHPDVNIYRQYVGMIPSKMELSLQVGQIVTGSFEFFGKKMLALAGSTGMGTPTASQVYGSANAIRGIFDIIEGGTSISATTYIKGGSLMFDNSLRVQEAVGNYGAVGVAPGTINAGGKLEVFFADATIYNKFINNTESSLSIPIQDPLGNGYVYYFPRIKYSAGKVNATGLDQDNVLSMEFTALPDITAGSPTLGKVLVIDRVGF